MIYKEVSFANKKMVSIREKNLKEAHDSSLYLIKAAPNKKTVGE